MRRHIAQSLMQHHRLIERSNNALRPVSPASFGSSMEVNIVLIICSPLKFSPSLITYKIHHKNGKVMLSKKNAVPIRDDHSTESGLISKRTKKRKKKVKTKNSILRHSEYNEFSTYLMHKIILLYTAQEFRLESMF